MRKAAFIANVGLLLAIAWYLLAADSSFEAEGVEWLILVLVFASPVVSIVALVPGRARGGATRTVAVIANVALVAAVFTYLVTCEIQHLERRELLLFAVMLSAPGLSVIVLMTRHAAAEPGRPLIHATCPTGGGQQTLGYEAEPGAPSNGVLAMPSDNSRGADGPPPVS